METTFLRHGTHTSFGRLVAGILSAALAAGGVPPVYAGSADAPLPVAATGATVIASVGQTPAGPPPTAGATRPMPSRPVRVKVNRTVPEVRPVPLVPELSEDPSDREIFFARIFEEPLVPVGGATGPEENRALASAIRAYVSSGNPEDLTPFEAYLEAHESTPWRAALLLDLGLAYRRLGRVSRAMRAWDDAWQLAKDQAGLQARMVADRAVGELALLRARFAQVPETEKLLSEAEGRTMVGLAKEEISLAQENLFVRKVDPDQVRPSGPYALASILKHTQPEYRGDRRIEGFRAPQYGTSLSQVAGLASEVGLPMQIAYRADKGAPIPARSVAHLKLGHFVPIVAASGGRYLVDDPLFGGERWLRESVLDDETSEYFLLPEGPLPAGWRQATAADGDNVFGRCDIPPHPHQTRRCDCSLGGSGGPCCTGPGGGGPGGGGPAGGGPGGGGPSGGGPSGGGPSDLGPATPMGMPRYSFHALRASLHITDTPLGYTPPRGPSVNFTVTYNQREATQPQTFTYSNLGQRWTFGYLAFIEDTPSDPMMKLTLHVPGGGAESFDTTDGQTFGPNFLSYSVITRTSSSPIRYEVQYTNGWVDVYAQPESGVSATRRVFLTESSDPTGTKLTFTYDENLRLVAITDAIGQVTTVSYERPDDPLKITRVTDPFDRSATFEYDLDGALVRITDVMGMSSEFRYSGDFVAAMTTPYGTTQFHTEDNNGEAGHSRMIEAVDPLGGREHLVYAAGVTGGPGSSEPAGLVPTGFADENSYLDQPATYFWDKRAMELYPGDFGKAYAIHWLRDLEGFGYAVKHSEKRALENRVWYGYQGKTYAPRIGSMSQPSKVARVLDDGTSQIYWNDYNERGLPVRSSDPLGRTTYYTYAPNNIDLLEVRHLNGLTTDLLASYTYNDKHQVLTATDASGQTTTYAYTANNQLHTVVAPPHGGLSEAQRTTTYAYDNDGYLASVTGPVAGTTTTYEYDGYGRLWRVTDPESYAVITEYDALDRPTLVTYPDSTYEETVYDKLDATKHRDRLGRWTETLYDALGRPVATRDPAGRTTQKNEWVNCPTGCGGGGAKLSKLVDANGNTTTWQYDVQGRVTTETRANGAEYSYTYENTTSRLKQVQDPNGNVKTYSYNRDNTLAGITYQPGSGVAATPNVSFTYDPGYNRVVSMTDGTGTTQYAYQAVAVPPTLGAGKLKSVNGPLDNDTIEYGHDELGRVTLRQIGSSANTQSQEFDALGRLTEITNPLGEFAYTYDGVTGRPASVTYPNGQQTTYAYLNNLGDHRLQEIHNKKPGGATLSKFNYTYDAVGNIMTWRQQTESNPAQVYEFGYDPVDQLASAILKSTDPTPVLLKRYYYGYDPAGNRTAEQIDDSVRSWTYNNMNQLVTEQAGGALLFKGTVNEPATVTVGGKPATVTADGRFTGAAVVPSGSGEVVVAATDYASPTRNTRTNTYGVTQSGATKSFTFDSNGNLTSDGSKTYAWDAENRLVSVSQGGTTLATFTYNWRSIRTSKRAGGVETTYALEGDSVVEERLSTGGTTRHLHGPGVDNVLATIDAAGAPSYYARDHLGSIRQRTDTSGQPMLTRDYDPWGSLLTGGSASGWAFTGREWDPEIASYYYRARYYSPAVGAFVSEDPFSTEEHGTLYRYGLNAPTLLTDPSGRCPCDSPNPPKACKDCETKRSNCWLLANFKSALVTAICVGACALIAGKSPAAAIVCVLICATIGGYVKDEEKAKCDADYRRCIGTIH